MKHALSPLRRSVALGLVLIAATITQAGAQAPNTTHAVHIHQSGEGGIFANAYLVETKNGVVAIDATLTESESKALHAQLAALHKPLLAVLITHGHPDHYNGVTNLVAGAKVPIVSTRGVADVIRQHDAEKEAQWKPVFKDEWPSQRTFPNRSIADGESLAFDGVRFTVHDLGPGESHRDSIWIASAPGWSAAFIGDVVLQGVHAYLSDGHSTAWLKNIERVRGLTRSASAIYPGHGEPGGAELFDQQRDYLVAYRKKVAELAAGRDKLSEPEKERLETAMLDTRKTERLRFLIKLGADPVARELAR